MVNALTQWMPTWKRRGWVKAGGQPPAKVPLLKELDRALAGRVVDIEWVRGHAGDPLNEAADRLCRGAARAIQDGLPLWSGPGCTGGTPTSRTCRVPLCGRCR